MIFNKYCDKVLWTLLEGEEKNRERIVNFIQSIPFELYDKIRGALSKFDEYERNNVDLLERDESNISEEIFLSNNYRYWFSVDMMVGTLTVGRSFNDIKDMEITLYTYSGYNMDDERVLGYVDFEDLKLGSVCYELVNTNLGKKVISSRKGHVKRYIRVNTELIPEDINIDNLIKSNGFTRIRCRKRV